jgi:hypothetical protein
MFSPFFEVFSIIVFLGGCAFGGFVLLIVSIHRTRRASLFEASSQRRGVISRSLLLTTRRSTGRK